MSNICILIIIVLGSQMSQIDFFLLFCSNYPVQRTIGLLYYTHPQCFSLRFLSVRWYATILFLWPSFLLIFHLILTFFCGVYILREEHSLNYCIIYQRSPTQKNQQNQVFTPKVFYLQAFFFWPLDGLLLNVACSSFDLRICRIAEFNLSYVQL